jgi:hypothetical protein
MRQGVPQIVPGSIVQVHPAKGGVFASCLLIVEEVRGWGVIGFAKGAEGAHVTATWEDIEPTGGKAVWMPE